MGALIGFIWLIGSVQDIGRVGPSVLPLDIGLSLMLLGGSLTWIVKAWRISKSGKLAPVEKQIQEKQAEIAEVNSRIAENRRIVDSTKGPK